MFVADPAFAASVKQVGLSFFDGGNQSADRLTLTVFDPPDRVAGLVADTNHLDQSQPSDRLVVLFTNQEDWAKFASIWSKARHAKRPKTDAEAYSEAADVGSYFDPVENTMVSVSLDTEGDIDFVVAGKPDADKKPTVLAQIELVPGDFKAFGEDVRTISAYFAK